MRSVVNLENVSYQCAFLLCSSESSHAPGLRLFPKDIMPEPQPSKLPSESEQSEGEYQLEPIADSPPLAQRLSLPQRDTGRAGGFLSANASQYRKNPHAVLYAREHLVEKSLGPRMEPRSPEVLAEGASRALPETNYRTIGTLRRYLLFGGYFTLVAVPIFLTVRFLHLLLFTSGNADPWLSSFFMYAFGFVAMSALAAAFLLAGSEILKLTLDVADDMRRMATLLDRERRPDDDMNLPV